MRLALPVPVTDLLDVLLADGHEAALVGGCVRDLVRGDSPGDWDVATSAPVQRVVELFPGSNVENRFGTVTVRRSGLQMQVTPYRIESAYRDHRRPSEVRFGGDIEDDLARRDFTINAMAWMPAEFTPGDRRTSESAGEGPEFTPGVKDEAPDGPGPEPRTPRVISEPPAEREGRLIDPHGGRTDLERRVLRSVGRPEVRFEEDALRLLRAVRFATLLDLEIEERTRYALARLAGNARHLSGERLRDELTRILRATDPPPSHAFRLMEELQLLPVVLPELAQLRGIPQGKPLPGDALDHSLRTADALPPDDPILRLAGLLHDLGKATTLADGHFIGHENVGADLARLVMQRLRFSRAEIGRVAHLVRQHMFAYAPAWTDAAVRRFILRVGRASLPDLFALRRADNAASGIAEGSIDGLRELTARIEAVSRGAALEPAQLAVHGDDLMAELRLRPGRRIGQLLATLMEAVLEDPAANDRETLLSLARRRLAELPERSHPRSRGRSRPPSGRAAAPGPAATIDRPTPGSA